MLSSELAARLISRRISTVKLPRASAYELRFAVRKIRPSRLAENSREEPISITGELGSLPIAAINIPSAAPGNGALGSVDRIPSGEMRDRPATITPDALI